MSQMLPNVSEEFDGCLTHFVLVVAIDAIDCNSLVDCQLFLDVISPDCRNGLLAGTRDPTTL